MIKVVKSVLGAGAILAAMTTHAAAETCILFLCLGGDGKSGGDTGGGGGGGSAPSAPEIDASQGLTAIAVLAVAVLLMRERFLRQRAI
ncbi:hypothetical protein [Terricaulis silvestris]|uniref:VPEID-CTERM protein sorting domain protein n=1 Tax=Terricaulis silvestris TaxID=2686094 RepID=A0A6I6MJL7_9CAUL|nr:hypothetical protein [Terricaulis silvestris]QGZ95475.1 VPEID-CTERM protein sorting domain protein [Terricaulis silvestris]